MGVLEEKISKSSAANPATAVVRNYLNSHPVYASRSAEWGYKGVWSIQLDLYDTTVSPKTRCFSTVGRGVKSVVLEEGYLKMAKWIDSHTFCTQGLDEGNDVQDELNVVKPEDVPESSVAENVIITGAEESKIVPLDSSHFQSLLNWSSTEKYYEFMDSASGVMNRWFPLDSVKVTTSDGPAVNGGLKQMWQIPGEIFMNSFDSINVLPIRGFVLGRYNLEFKMTLQANPFQACCVMMSQCPNDYGLTKFTSIKSFNMNSTLDPSNISYDRGNEIGYNDFRVAIQRPHVLIDVASGGEATMQFTQKYHKTLIRNFDYSFVPSVNPGIRGSNYGSIALHVLAPLRVGTGSPPHFNVRIFYRFVDAKLTGMSSTASKESDNYLAPLRPLPFSRREEAKQKLRDAMNKRRTMDRQKGEPDPYNLAVADISTWTTQGPVMSVVNTARGVVDVADKALHVVEDFGTVSRKGFNVRNRDKPNDTVHVVKVVPRPRTNFLNGEGIDDALVMGLSWIELTQFFETFDNEPKSIKDFISKTGYLGTFTWSTDHVANTKIFEWGVHPTLTPDLKQQDLSGNFLSSPVGIASSFYTNYFGTMELYFQFIKTQFHKGSVEVAIHFGRSVNATGLSSSYVKVLNVQECNGFSVTVPYIYDTAVRTISGTSTPMVIPPLFSNGMYRFSHSAIVSVKVVNELVAPESVHSNLDVIVWLKGGTDFGLNFPRACNTVSTSINLGVVQLPYKVREVFSSPAPQPQYFYTPTGVGSEPTISGGFYTQGEDDDTPDFNQPPYEGNRNTNIEHLNFKTLLKMPVKLLNNYIVEPFVDQEYVVVDGQLPGTKKTARVRNYLMLPVTVLNPTLLNYLDSSVYSRTNKFRGMNFPLNQSIHNQITQMFGMFRGSLVYTIVLNAGKTANVSYLPHDYVLRAIQGPLNTPDNLFESSAMQVSAFPSWNILDSNNITDVGSCLPYTTFINGQVNPSEKVVIPMSSPNNWLLLNRRISNSTKEGLTTLRENLEWFNGHLLIWSNEKIEVDVYLNCGDDFELGGFLGHTGVMNPYSLFALKDNWRTQGPSDFYIKELTSNGWNSIKKLAVNTVGATVGAVVSKIFMDQESPAIAAVTGAIAIYSCVGGIEQVQRLRSIMNAGTQQIEHINKMAEDVCEVGVETIVKILQNSFPFLLQINSVGKTVWVVAQHIVHSVISNNWRNVAFGFFCVLMETKIFEIHDWGLLKDKLIDLVTAFCPSSQNFTTQGDSLQEVGESVMQLIATMICAKLQITGTGGLSWYFKEMFAWQNYKHVSGLNSILSFARVFFRAVSNVFVWLFSKADPNVSLLKALSVQDVELTEFLEESNLYLNSFNDNDFKRRDNRIRFLKVIMRAFKLRLVLLRIANPKITGQLLQHCNKVIDKAQKQRYLFKCDVVKTEPFVLCIEGNTNVGKSFAVTDLVSSMLHSVNYKGSSEDVVFTVAAGVDYWNGYADQPAVVYDDWCNLRDEQTLRQHISQLYQLKTSAPFNVPRAELENKEQIASPQIVVLSTNVPFPTSSIFNCPKAVWRRRDCMVKVSLQEGKEIKDFTEDQLHAFDHIRIQVYQDVCDPASLEQKFYTYTEFVDMLKDQFVKFHMRELRNKQFKYDILQKNIVKTKVDQLNLSNPFELLDQLTLESEELLSSEVLDREVERLMQLIHETVELSNHEPKDSEIFETQGVLGECKKIVVSRVKNIQELARNWFSKAKKAIMLCEHCHGTASKYGTVFWCEEHNHYLCLHCGALSGTINRPYEENGEMKYEGDKPIVCKMFKCILHETVLSVKQEPFIKAFIAEMIANRVQGLLDLWTAARVMTGGQITTTRSLYGFLKCVEAYVTIAWGQIMRNMAFKMFCQDSLDIKVQTNSYLNHPKWDHDTEDYRGKFQNGQSCSKTRYVCPHSLLVNPYSYYDNLFCVMFDDETVMIPDKICSQGKCVLLNLHFLEQVVKKFEVSPEYVEGYVLKRTKVIARYFPRFMWPLNFERLIDKTNLIQRMFNKNWWQHYVSPLGEKVTSWVKRVYPLLIGVGVLWASVKLYKHVWAIIGKIFGIDLMSEGLEQSSGEKSRRSKGRQRGKRSTPFNTQAVSENFENKLNKIAANYIVVKCGKSTFTAWGLYNSTFLMPKHLLPKLSRDPMVHIAFVTHAGDFVMSRDKLVVTEYDKKDLARVEVMGQKVMFKDCSRFLQDRSKFSLESLTKGVFMDSDTEDGMIYDLDVQLLNMAHNTMASDSGGCNYLTDIGVMYNYQRPGACGSLVCVDSTNPVLSMHISGADSLHKGIGVILFQDDYMTQAAPEVLDTDENTPFFGDECNIVYEGSVEKALMPFVPKKTQIIPSLISESICAHEPLTQPAILDKSDPRYRHDFSPLYYGVVKNGKPTLDFPTALLDKAYQGIKDIMLGGSIIRRPTVLSVDEAVLGFPQIPVDDPYMDDDSQYFGAIPLDTSAGWPYSTVKYQNQYGIRTTSKSGWIKYVRDKGGFPIGCEVHEKILADHAANMEVRLRGLPAINIFQDCLKDERRPIAKLMKEGGTRLFSMSNVEGTIALRRYTLDLTSHLRKNRLSNFIAVGINPESTEWTVLANMLLAKGNNIFTTDFTNFGAGLNYYCGMKFVDLICDFYKEKGDFDVDRRVVEALIVELMGSRHIVQNLIYRTQCGSPSGAAITVEMNSFVHMLYIMMSWLIIGEVYGKVNSKGNLFARDLNRTYSDLEDYLRNNCCSGLTFTVDDFYANVMACVYGDDGIFSVTDEYREVFNSKTINLVLKDHGIGVTDASKSEQIVKYAPLSEATFLKRRFVPNELLDLLFAAQIQWQTVEECVRWIHRTPLTPEEATRENCEASLLLAWGHGRAKYTWWLEQINAALRRVKLRPIVLTWDDIGKKYFSDIVVT